jgi:thiol-disulfide isomerase/thioredoxin
LAKVNVDNAEDLSALFKIQAMPTFVAYSKDKTILLTKTGGGKNNVDDVFNAAKNKK